MTELERKAIKQSIDDNDKSLMFYGCYVDDTLVVIKSEDLNRVHNVLNNFDRNFILDTFNDIVPHGLDIKIHPDGLGIYCKPTNTGQYTHYASFSSWRDKTAWIANIIEHATVICDETKIQTELNRIKKIINHIYDCANYQYMKNLYCTGNKSFHPYAYDINSIQENTNIIDSAINWKTLLIKEMLHIKLKKPVLNNGLKASKELQLFN